MTASKPTSEPSTPPSPSSAKPSAPSPTLRRTRFVLISDTHKCTPALPPGDVLIHAGDLTNQGSFSELSRAVQWLEKADFEAKIVVAGNHDLALDRTLYQDNESRPHANRHSDSSTDSCTSLLTSSPTITYLAHDAAQIRLTSPKGPRTTFKVFGSPCSPRNPGHGIFAAFTYAAPGSSDFLVPAEPSQPHSQPQAEKEDSLPTLWDDIPLDTDILVTHTPPRTHCDQNRDRLPAGCKALQRALWRVRPRLSICGHVHEARGAERVLWADDVPFREARVRPWDDPEPVGKRLSLVDLTAKGGDPLLNDGSHGRLGRQETCVVNCAIMAKSYPHVGGRTMNKPIVVDLDLPTWDS